MEITKEQDGQKVVFRVKGCLDTVATPAFSAAVEAGVPADAKAVAFDCTEMEFISSAALRVLVSLHRRLPGLAISLTGLNDVVREVFEITGLKAVFTLA